MPGMNNSLTPEELVRWRTAYGAHVDGCQLKLDPQAPEDQCRCAELDPQSAE